MFDSQFGRRLSAFAFLALAAGGSAQAATDGTLGATSTGSVVINATVPSSVRISGLDDVNFSNQDPAVAASNAQNVCVWSNTATRGYRITASGNGAASAFTLQSGALAPVPYSVQWDDVSGQTSGSALTATTALTGQTSAATSSNCSSGSESASLIVGITTANLQTMQSGATYTGTLTLLVAPE
jgi:hypothetical protein